MLFGHIFCANLTRYWVYNVKAWLLEYEKRLNDMDHMRISSIEPSSVILAKQTKNVEKMYHKSVKTNWSQKGWWITPKISISINFNTENGDALETLRINWSRPWNLAECALRDSLFHQQWHSPSEWSGWSIKRSRCIHHFKWDFINNMNHMCTLGTEPSSVILIQTR